MLIPHNLIGILGSDSSLRSSLMMKNEQASSLVKQGCASLFLSFNLHYLFPFYNMLIHSTLVVSQRVGKGRAINHLS